MNSQSKSILQRVIDNPDQGFSQLPVLLDQLEHDSPSVRLTAVVALCLIAEGHPDRARLIYERCGDRDSFAAAWGRQWLLYQYGDDEWPTPDSEKPREWGTVDLAVISGTSSRPESNSMAVLPEEPDDRRESEHRGNRPETHSKQNDSAAKSQTSPRQSRRQNNKSDPLERDDVVEDGKFTVSADQTEINSFQLIEPVSHHEHLNTYKGIGHVRGKFRSLLIRAYTPPATESTSQFATAFGDVIPRWEELGGNLGVTTVFDWGQQPAPWVITNYTSDTLWTTGRLSPKTAYQTGIQLATAVASGHENGVTHGGLSPNTVLFDWNGSTSDAYITDFGICPALQTAGCPLPLHQSYIAPEMAEDGHGEIDWMTDIYQLGLVLYTMFTGKIPNERPGVDNPVGPDPTNVVDGLPSQTDWIVKKATATHKISRYDSAQELVRDLQTTLEQR